MCNSYYDPRKIVDRVCCIVVEWTEYDDNDNPIKHEDEVNVVTSAYNYGTPRDPNDDDVEEELKQLIESNHLLSDDGHYYEIDDWNIVDEGFC